MSIYSEVAQTIDEFYRALNVLFTGDSAAMKALWSHADDVTYMGPDGKYLIGWADISAEWDRQAALVLGGRVEPTRLRSVVGADLVVITCVEAGANDNGIEGKTVSIRSSTVFRREGGAWKAIGHQTDPLPYV